MTPRSSLSWNDLHTLLKAAHNPRFCRNRATAADWMREGGKGDSCALIGGFPFVVGTTFPSNHNTKYFKVRLYEYMDTPSATSWKNLEEMLGVVAPTGQEREELCKAIYDSLYQGLQNLLDSNEAGDVHMIMVKASKGSWDHGRLYGPLGKAGNSTISAQDVSNQVFHGQTPARVQEQPQKVRILVSAVVIMAAKVVSRLGF